MTRKAALWQSGFDKQENKTTVLYTVYRTSGDVAMRYFLSWTREPSQMVKQIQVKFIAKREIRLRSKSCKGCVARINQVIQQ